MATISLYAAKVNRMPELLKNAQKKVNDLKSELSGLNKKILKIDSSACDVYEETGIVQASVSIQGELYDSLGTFSDELEEFISETIEADADATAVINSNKKDFYEKYSYLKPECEKSKWEKFKDKLKKAGEWCKEHWKLVVTVVLVIAAIVVICVCPAAGIGLIALGAAKGLIAGAVIGGIIGGISSKAQGGSFLDGFEDAAFSGALMGALFGGIGGAGELAGRVLGESCKFIATYGSTIKNATTALNVLNLGMGGFDTISLAISIFDNDNPIVKFNKMLHSSKLYNGFQLTVGALGAFGGGMMKGIQYDMANGISKCFIAGTLVCTINGLTAIENIRAGDMVLSANPETGVTEYRKVVETYIRETMKLVHLTVKGEKIITTEGHPFYVKDRGFVNAIDLTTGDELLDSNGNVLLLEDFSVELVDSPVKVYNFQVEQLHTYFVSELGVWVHNADKQYKIPKSGTGKEKATDIPSRFKGQRPYVNESGKQFATRLCDEAFGKGNYETGPKSAFNQLKKYGDRAFTDPK